MSLRLSKPDADTDGSSYRRMFWHNHRTRQRVEEERRVRIIEEERRMRQEGMKDEQNVKGAITFNITMPTDPIQGVWSNEQINELWTQLSAVANQSVNQPITLTKFIKALDDSKQLRNMFGIPFPNNDISGSITTNTNKSYTNRRYANRLYRAVAATGLGVDFSNLSDMSELITVQMNRDDLIQYLTATKNPLQYIQTNSRVHNGDGRLPAILF